MTNNRVRITEYLRNHPTATNRELAEALGINNANVRVTINRLEQKGLATIEREAGKPRKVNILKLPNDPTGFKKETYEMLVNTYLMDFEETELFKDRLAIGNVILRLLEKL